MPRKPSVTYDVPVNRASVEQAVGPRLGKLFVPNPRILESRTVLRFPREKVIASGEFMRALDKVGTDRRPTLAVGHDFTKEARLAAAEMSCDIISEREHGWTDARIKIIRKEIG